MQSLLASFLQYCQFYSNLERNHFQDKPPRNATDLVLQVNFVIRIPGLANSVFNKFLFVVIADRPSAGIVGKVKLNFNDFEVH